MRAQSLQQSVALLFIFLCCVSVFGISLFMSAPSKSMDSPPPFAEAPLGLTAKIVYPHIGHAGFVLNGTDLEVQIRGPNNISSWDFTLYREYQSYSLSYGTPNYNVLTSIWSVNITIPTNAGWDLYDLRITVSDGITQLNLEEWNAVQVRHSWPKNYTIFHVSDTHFFAYESGFSRRLQAAQYQAALAGADAMILTGDLTDAATGGAFQQLRETMSESRVPYLILPGNHDRDPTGPTFNNYKSYFGGTDYYTATIGPDILIIMSNTYQQTGERYRFNTTQLSWIERDLNASSAKTKILAGHAPLLEPDQDVYFIPTSEALELQRIARENNLTVYLSGHLHNDRVDLINGTYFMLTTPIGGSTWTTGPGHHENGLRRLIFENYSLTSWSWTNWNWSQPYNLVQVQRDRTNFRTQTKGGYMTITNNLSSPLLGQIIDFIVDPLSGPEVYQVSGGSVQQTINGTTSWFIRVTVDIPIDGIVTIRVFPSNAQAPNIDQITHPNPGIVGAVTQIVVEASNPISGVQAVYLNLSLNSGPYSMARMTWISGETFRYVRFYSVRTTLDFTVNATDFSGFSTNSSLRSFVVTSQPGSPILADPGDTSATGNVSLSWTQSIDDDGTIDHYTIQVSDSVGFFNIVRSENASGTTITIYGLTNNTYFFRVQATDNDNAASDWSNNHTILVAIPPEPPTTPPPPPPPPINWVLIGTLLGGTAIALIVIGVIVYFVRFRESKPT